MKKFCFYLIGLAVILTAVPTIYFVVKKTKFKTQEDVFICFKTIDMQSADECATLVQSVSFDENSMPYAAFIKYQLFSENSGNKSIYFLDKIDQRDLQCFLVNYVKKRKKPLDEKVAIRYCNQA